MAETRVGISGWRYAPWRRRFYPAGLPQRRELEYASRRVSSIEINGTFYSLQRPELFEHWYQETPPDFVFAVKGSRFITHMKKLKDVEAPLANFFASGVLKLEEKLGPFLWQFPAGWRFDAKRLDAFFRMLPRDVRAAAALAKEHDHRLKGRSFTEPTHRGPLRHAVEVRDQSFFVPEMISLLRRHRIAWVIAETAGVFPYAEDLTADFLYLRLHGSQALYRSGYSEPELERWTQRIRRWRAGKEPSDAIRIAPIDRRYRGFEKDVYVYFDNTDVALRAPYDAMALMERLKLTRGHWPDAIGERP